MNKSGTPKSWNCDNATQSNVCDHPQQTSSTMMMVMLCDRETWQRIQVMDMTEEVNGDKIQPVCLRIPKAGNISLWPHIKVFCVIYYSMDLLCVECTLHVWKHPASFQLQGNSAYHLYSFILPSCSTARICVNHSEFLLKEKYLYHCNIAICFLFLITF